MTAEKEAFDSRAANTVPGYLGMEHRELTPQRVRARPPHDTGVGRGRHARGKDDGARPLHADALVRSLRPTC
jgi:hypothetical protein